jgi:hypothetical protein
MRLRIDRGFLGWGVFFLVLGLVPLSVQLGWIDRDVVTGLWRLWPLFLVAGGLGLVLRRTRLAGLGGVLAAATGGLLLGGLLATGVGIGIACGPPSNAETVADRTGTLGPGGSVDVDVSCTRLTGGAVDGSGWRVAWGPSDADAPRVEAGASRLEVSNPTGGSVINTGLGGAVIDVSLPRAAVGSLRLQVNAGEATLPLDGLALGAVRVQANAADARLDLAASTASTIQAEVNVGSLRLGLPATPVRSVQLDANLARVVICAPPQLGVRLVASGGLASWDLPGLTKVGDTYTSEGFASASGTTVEISANLSSVSLDRGGACR